jgi:hypothetical protein
VFDSEPNVLIMQQTTTFLPFMVFSYRRHSDGTRKACIAMVAEARDRGRDVLP